MQAWGLIVLLLSKAAGYASTIPEMEQDQSVGILHSQRALAEVTEMIRISHLVHQGLVNLQPLTQAGQDMALHGDMTFGNKIALLSGDYLLGNSCAELAALRYAIYLLLFIQSLKKLNFCLIFHLALSQKSRVGRINFIGSSRFGRIGIYWRS